ncbi:hypothetical protein CLOP_g2721 [Closterium sp. NIES-67]|nr:hypothetical protein CLOP_g2721 [Closterium sp. NIES-67]
MCLVDSSCSANRAAWTSRARRCWSGASGSAASCGSGRRPDERRSGGGGGWRPGGPWLPGLAVAWPLRPVMSSAYARQRTRGNAWAVSRRAGCMAAAKSRGPMGSPCLTPRALRRGWLSKPASKKRVEGAP